jgi:hypothetical protein
MSDIAAIELCQQLPNRKPRTMVIKLLSNKKSKYPKCLHWLIWQSPNSGIRLTWHFGGSVKSIAVFRWFKNGRLRLHCGSGRIA